MLINTLGEKRSYNPDDHLFIFLSLVYAFTVNTLLSNISMVARESYVQEGVYWPNSIMILGWNFLMVALATQSWWGVWADKRHFSRDFKNFVVLLSYPALLCIVAESLSSLHVVLPNQEFLHKEYLFFLGALMTLFISLIGIRCWLDTTWDYFRLRVLCVVIVASLTVITYSNAIISSSAAHDSTFKLIILSLLVQVFGFSKLFDYTKKKRNNLFSKSELERDEFLKKVSSMASLPYRYGTPFSFLIVKIRGEVNEESKTMYDYMINTIVKKTRGYHLCSNLADHIAIFIPYIHTNGLSVTSDIGQAYLDQKAQQLENKIKRRLKENLKTKDLDIVTGVRVYGFDNKRINEISLELGKKGGSSHVKNLQRELRNAYNLAYDDVAKKTLVG